MGMSDEDDDDDVLTLAVVKNRLQKRVSMEGKQKIIRAHRSSTKTQGNGANELWCAI